MFMSWKAYQQKMLGLVFLNSFVGPFVLLHLVVATGESPLFPLPLLSSLISKETAKIQPVIVDADADLTGAEALSVAEESRRP